MEKKDITEKKDKKRRLNQDGDDRYAPGQTNSVPGINSPEISLPAFNPPIPNRAWTAMRAGVDIDMLSEEEKRELYVGRDNLF